MAVDRDGARELLGEYRGWVVTDWAAPGGYRLALIPTRRWLELTVERAGVDVATEAAGLLLRLEPVAASSRAVIAARFPGAA